MLQIDLWKRVLIWLTCAAGLALADLFVGRVEAIDTDYQAYDFATWRELSAFKSEFAATPQQLRRG